MDEYFIDEYTQKTKVILEDRYKKHDKYGIYFAHQPIYGFRKGHSESFTLVRYIRTYQIIKALSHLKFNSLLDVGGGEGYSVYIAREIFDVNVKNCELSEEACKRAKEIFNIDSDPADIHNLPYTDNQFDVVLCSETLEHVTDVNKSISELLRVASKSVIITVPHQSTKFIEDNIRKKIPHGHIHNFNLQSFNFLKTKGYLVFSKKMVSPLLKIHRGLIEAMPLEYNKKDLRREKIFKDVYNASLPLLRRLFNKKAACFLLKLDEFISKWSPLYGSIIITIILKNDALLDKRKIHDISPDLILNMEVPYYYIKK